MANQEEEPAPVMERDVEKRAPTLRTLSVRWTTPSKIESINGRGKYTAPAITRGRGGHERGGEQGGGRGERNGRDYSSHWRFGTSAVGEKNLKLIRDYKNETHENLGHRHG